jgi:polyisoprenoid-binding protein YceI
MMVEDDMATTTWQLDPSHSSIGFSIRHLVVSKVRGRFTDWEGQLAYDPQAPERAAVSVRIRAASVTTAEPQRDAHLRSADFFDVEAYPELTFSSREVEPAGQGRFNVVGPLTLHGVTKDVALEVEYLGQAKDPWGGQRAGFSAKASIDRRDFGLSFNQVLETGGVLVGDRVDIQIDIQAIQRAAAAA